MLAVNLLFDHAAMSHSEVVSAINGIGEILIRLTDRMVRSEKELVAINSASKTKVSGQKRAPIPLVVKVSLFLCII